MIHSKEYNNSNLNGRWNLQMPVLKVNSNHIPTTFRIMISTYLSLKLLHIN